MSMATLQMLTLRAGYSYQPNIPVRRPSPRTRQSHRASCPGRPILSSASQVGADEPGDVGLHGHRPILPALTLPNVEHGPAIDVLDQVVVEPHRLTDTEAAAEHDRQQVPVPSVARGRDHAGDLRVGQDPCTAAAPSVAQHNWTSSGRADRHPGRPAFSVVDARG